MSKVLGSVLAALLFVHLAVADDSKSQPQPNKASTPAEQFSALMGEVEKAQQDAMIAYRGAKTDEERRRIIEDLSKKPQAYAGRLLELARKNPKEKLALEALAFIAVNLRAGRELDQAIELLLDNHMAKLAPLCGDLARTQSPGAERLLRGIMAKTSDRSLQGIATLSLGQLLKGMADSGGLNREGADRLAKEAEKYFDRVAKEFGDVEDLADQAKGDLFELRNLSIGKTAPDISGKDGEDKELKLTEYRGKVVVLDFWASWCGPCMAMVPHERELVKRLDGKPFAFVGVNVDDTKADLNRAQKANRMTWRSFFDGRSGPIGKEWNIRAYPTIFVLDHKGVIRYKGVRGRAMDEAVDTLLKEMRTEN
jgi:thiol-disulfide isomerase/thioredoxin